MQYMEEDIQNSSQTVMFRGTLCNSKPGSGYFQVNPREEIEKNMQKEEDGRGEWDLIL